MRAELASLSQCAVHFLSCAAANLCWYCSVSRYVHICHHLNKVLSGTLQDDIAINLGLHEGIEGKITRCYNMC